jgi:methylase of polypeptide subunit release factors
MAKKQPKITVIERDISDLIFAEYNPRQMTADQKQHLTDSMKRFGSVLDVFLGSGSTLIACEKTNRKCYGMEIDPIYCDVIIKRWEDYTGKKAELYAVTEG